MNHSSPSNTTAQVHDNPLGIVAASMGSGGFSQAIEEQERNGQAQIVNSTVLPVEGSSDPALLDLGFTFGDVVPGDDLFREATLPEGWAREGSDHAMHSYIVDERGIRRVNVFYKAAFYDRRADMNILNVGYQTATNAIYGDGDVALDDRLTVDELADTRTSAEAYMASAEQAPGIYGDRAPRAAKLLRLLDEASA